VEPGRDGSTGLSAKILQGDLLGVGTPPVKPDDILPDDQLLGTLGTGGADQPHGCLFDCIVSSFESIHRHWQYEIYASFKGLVANITPARK
jgi:hypothetical protein